MLRARSRFHFVKEFAGPLSIKSVTERLGCLEVRGRERWVDRDSFLVLNRGEPYSMEIDSRTPVSTLCVFFANGFVESVCGCLTHPDDLHPTAVETTFAQRLYTADVRILPRMHALSRARTSAKHADDPMWLDQQFLDLAGDLAMLQRDLRRRVSLLPASRPGTRAALFCGVRRAQELLHDSPAEDLDLQTLAREAGISPYHFHRAFRAAFGQTPHAYRTGLRMAHARRLLETSELSVIEVSTTVGFASAASFANLFRRTFGTPPSAVRKSSKIR